jgi:hypothetical protein
MLTPGRGSNVGGNQQSLTTLTGNKFWKYLVWKYVTQLMEPDVVPDYLEAHDELVSSKHNTTRDSRTCSYCESEFGTKNHGHSSNEIACVGYKSNASAAKRQRTERKIKEARALGGNIIKTEKPKLN